MKGRQKSDLEGWGGASGRRKRLALGGGEGILEVRSGTARSGMMALAAA